MSLERLLDFEVLGDEDADKPVLALNIVENHLLVTGDKRLYVYDADFEKMIGEAKKAEEEASLGEDVREDAGAEGYEVV